MTLVGDVRLSSAAMGLELVQWDSCIQLTKPLVYNLSGAQHGGHICTMPFSIFQQLVKHPLTDHGVNKFLADWNPQLQKSPSAGGGRARPGPAGEDRSGPFTLADHDHPRRGYMLEMREYLALHQKTESSTE